MTATLKTLYGRLCRAPYLVQLLCFFLLSYLTVVIYIPVALVALLIGADAELSANAPKVDFFSMVIVAPLLETLIYQFAVFKLFGWLTPRNKYLPLIVSAIVFGPVT